MTYSPIPATPGTEWEHKSVDARILQRLIDLIGLPSAQCWPDAQPVLKANGLCARFNYSDRSVDVADDYMVRRYNQLTASDNPNQLVGRHAEKLMHTINCVGILMAQWDPFSRFTARRVLDQFFIKGASAAEMTAVTDLASLVAMAGSPDAL